MKRPSECKTRTRRLVPSLHHGLLVCEIADEGVWYRERGRRTTFLLPHGLAFQQAVKLHVARERELRKPRRTKRRGS